MAHMNFNDLDLTASWTLPASKTDTKALGSVRTHRCLCSEDGTPDKICPYHVAKANYKFLEEAFPEHIHKRESFPLFPTCKGRTLSHSGTVESIRSVAQKAGIPTQRQVGSVCLERFGEHVMRVSGAQHLTKELRWELFMVQLFGRWGSLAFALYVQDAPLVAAAQRPSQTPLAEVVKMLLEMSNPKPKDRPRAIADVGAHLDSDIGFEQGITLDPPDSIDEITELKGRVEQIMVKLKEIDSGRSLSEHLLSRVSVEEIEDRDDHDITTRRWVRNPHSKIDHIIIVDKDPMIPDEACITRCGWHWATAPHRILVSPPSANQGDHICKRCHGGDDDDRSSADGSSDDSAARESGQEDNL
jgi:hypothetical protein